MPTIQCYKHTGVMMLQVSVMTHHQGMHSNGFTLLNQCLTINYIFHGFLKLLLCCNT